MVVLGVLSGGVLVCVQWRRVWLWCLGVSEIRDINGLRMGCGHVSQNVQVVVAVRYCLVLFSVVPTVQGICGY